MKRLEHWNGSTQKVRNVVEEPSAIVNYQLLKLLLVVDDAYNEAKREGIVQGKNFFKSVIDAFRAGEGELAKRKAAWTLSEAFEAFIALQENPAQRHKGNRVKASTLNTYKVTLNLLSFYGMGKVALRSLDMDWYNSFCCRCEEGGKGGEGRASPFIDCGDEVLVFADAALVVGNDLHDFLGFQHCKLSCTALTVPGIRSWSATTFDRELQKTHS